MRLSATAQTQRVTTCTRPGGCESNIYHRREEEKAVASLPGNGRHEVGKLVRWQVSHSPKRMGKRVEQESRRTRKIRFSVIPALTRRKGRCDEPSQLTFESIETPGGHSLG